MIFSSLHSIKADTLKLTRVSALQIDREEARDETSNEKHQY